MWFVFLAAIGLTILLALLLFSLVSLVFASLSGAPYVPARADRIRAAVDLIQPKQGMWIADLGSGDGRIVRTLAKYGACVDGYEIQPILVLWSRAVNRIQRLDTAAYYCRDFFKVSLQRYDVVVMYALPSMMSGLRQKFEAELRPGAIVVSIAFPITGWKEIRKQNNVFVYEVTKRNS